MCFGTSFVEPTGHVVKSIPLRKISGECICTRHWLHVSVCANRTCWLNAVELLHCHTPSVPPLLCLVPLCSWLWIPVCDCGRRHSEPDSAQTPDHYLRVRDRHQRWKKTQKHSGDKIEDMWDTFSIQNDLLPSPPTSQSFTPPLTLSHDVWGEKIAIPDSKARIANLCFQSFWTKRLIGRNNGGWYEIMRSQLMASASSMTASVRSLVSSMVLIGRDLLGSTSRPTLSHDSARDRGASCSITCRTSFSSIRPEQRAERETQRVEEKWTDECRGTEVCWLVKKLWLWVGEEPDGGVDETVKGEEQRVAREVKLLLRQSLLQLGAKSFLHPVNISGDLYGSKRIITFAPPHSLEAQVYNNTACTFKRPSCFCTHKAHAETSNY